MAKTKFINGTTILSKWLNAIFGGGAKDLWAASTAYGAGDLVEITGGYLLRCIVAGTSGTVEPTLPSGLRQTVVDNTATWELFAGHLHDGNNFNGSSPQVDLTLAREVTGVLPLANMATHQHNGTQMAKVRLGDALDVDGVLPVANVGGFTEGVFGLQFSTSHFAVAQEVTARWRIDSAKTAGFPSRVTLFLPALVATGANSGTLAATGTPAIVIASKNDTFVNMLVVNNGIAHHGSIRINSDGSVAFNLAYNSSNLITTSATSFTANTSRGFYDSIITFPIFP